MIKNIAIVAVLIASVMVMILFISLIADTDYIIFSPAWMEQRQETKEWEDYIKKRDEKLKRLDNRTDEEKCEDQKEAIKNYEVEANEIIKDIEDYITTDTETYNRKQEKLKKAKKEIAESKRLKKEVEHYYCRTGVPRDIHTIPVTD